MREVANHETCNPDVAAVGFIIFIVPTSVADVWCGSNHNLAVVGRVGHGFLVTGHGGGKYRFTQGGASCAEA